ncbi:MAG: RagB/SusD family nutrient uptake outer membrane protein [Chitinophagaceae bacterium]|nr:RagB/SusD family nutrient uptake outer membrane protein [Chitinophagaceae bacterium]
MKRLSNKLAISLLAFITAMSFSLVSCKKDFLDRKPYTSLGVEDALKTEGDLLVALRGVYAGMRGGTYNAVLRTDLFGRTIPILGDLMADNVYQSVSNSNRYTLYNQYAMPVNDANATGMWTDSYNVILRSNNIINSSIDANVNVNQYKGEAHAIRALMYFNLVRFYAKPYTDNPAGLGVPIVTTFDLNLKPGRSTIGEVYDLILADLEKAYTLMTVFNGSSQFSKYAARALEAKVQLTKGDKVKAKTAALDVINNSGFTVVPAADVAAYWGNPAPRTDKVETLFEVSSDAVGNIGFDALGYIYNQSGYGDMLASDDLYALYSATDVRRTDLTAVGVRGGLPAVFVRKYLNIATDRDDTKVLRLSDVYLIAAEASLPGNEADALTYLNFIATRRDPVFLGYVSNGNQLFEDVITERRKELAFEGDRYHDLNRLKRPVIRSANYPASAQNILYTAAKRLLPIPQAETDANPVIRAQQNPGY